MKASQHPPHPPVSYAERYLITVQAQWMGGGDKIKYEMPCHVLPFDMYFLLTPLSGRQSLADGH